MTSGLACSSDGKDDEGAERSKKNKRHENILGIDIILTNKNGECYNKHGASREDKRKRGRV